MPKGVKVQVLSSAPNQVPTFWSVFDLVENFTYLIFIVIYTIINKLTSKMTRRNDLLNV